MVVAKLTLALLCFGNTPDEYKCYPMLYGVDTPRQGTYQLNLRITQTPGYGGDVIQFKETDTEVYSIHRVWTLNNNQRRAERLLSSNVRDNVITNGCINIDPIVYDKLKKCCSNN
jgi:signal peptidase I